MTGQAEDHLDRVLAQWASARPDLDAAPMGVVGRVSRASHVLGREMRAVFARHGLQPWEFDILATLLRAGPPHRLTAGALSEASLVTSGAITNRIDRLTDRGLVTRETDPGNRRSVLITLTGEGRRVIDAAVADHVAGQERLLSALAPAEREELASLLRKLLLSNGDTL
ncbi:MarR family winged helix-turn-helix transcriptional regulator [Actinomadura kijaniata]|uniref:MarR family winged helix-turn-helix transcriptional regulator n=1 Tax=Actinomadura kijaniata TaxID=46161 RepID=UPI00082CA730|nr:MarR family transcriptional regulator [Actinomadura kijaniata]